MVTIEDFELEHDKLIIDMMSAGVTKEVTLQTMKYLSILKKRLFS